MLMLQLSLTANANANDEDPPGSFVLRNADMASVHVL
jgi:hypothetical protein